MRRPDGSGTLCRPTLLLRTVLLLTVLLPTVVLLTVALPGWSAAPAAAEPSVAGTSEHTPAVVYQLPAAGAVLRSFEPAATAYGPGHRGVDLDVPVGGVVRAAARGLVHHAGDVAGSTWVSITHPDGVRTSYGPLATVQVARGHHVVAGTQLGVLASGGHGEGGADRGLHWGARVAGRYVDPLLLLAPGMLRPSLVQPGGWAMTDLVVTPYEPWRGGRAGGLLVASSPTADRPGYAVPPNGHHLVLLPGLATSDATELLDPGHLGYDPASVTRFSYAGRHDAPGDPDDPRRDQLPYDARHTWEGIPAAAARLEAQLRAQAAREPGRAVDLVGHSMGGMVAMYYLTHLHDPRDPGLPQLGKVVTIGSPLDGSDVARVATDLHGHSRLGRPLATGQRLLARGEGAIGHTLDTIALDAPALRQLATGSDTIAGLQAAWDAALADGVDVPLAYGTRVLTLGGARDVAVVADRARLPSGGRAAADGPEHHPHDGPLVQHRVLPGSHGGMLRTEAVREVVYDFLADDDVIEGPGHLVREAGPTAGQGATSVTGTARHADRWLRPWTVLTARPEPEVPDPCAAGEQAAAQPWCG
jgi:hypothetical protein